MHDSLFLRNPHIFSFSVVASTASTVGSRSTSDGALRNMIRLTRSADKFVTTTLGHDALRRVEFLLADRAAFSFGGHGIYMFCFKTT